MSVRMNRAGQLYPQAVILLVLACNWLRDRDATSTGDADIRKGL